MRVHRPSGPSDAAKSHLVGGTNVTCGSSNVSDGFAMTTEEDKDMVAARNGLTRAHSMLGTAARGSALAFLVAALLTGCRISTLAASANPQSDLGTIVGLMQGEGGAMSISGTGTWRICGSVTATEMGGHSPTWTVSTDATGEFTLTLPAGSYQLTSSNTISCAFVGRTYVTPSCVRQGTCYEATPAPVLVSVAAGRESHATLFELVP